MYWVSLYFMRWIQFWRVPETASTKRVESRSHCRRVQWIKNVWMIMLPALLITGQLALLTFGVVFMTFLSFMFLDEY